LVWQKVQGPLTHDNCAVLGLIYVNHIDIDL